MDSHSQDYDFTHFDFEQFQKQAEYNNTTMELLVAKFDDQTKKIKNLMNKECEWKKNNWELQYANESMKDQLLKSKSQITDLQCKLANSENNLQCVQKELCISQLQLKELKTEMNEAKKREGKKEESFCKMRKELDEYQYECNRIKIENCTIKDNLKSLNSQLYEANVILAREKNNYVHEQEKLSKELVIKRRQMNSLQEQYDEKCRKEKEYNYKIKKIMSTLIELRDASIIYCNSQKSQILNLKKENCANKEKLSRYENKFKQMYRENEILCMEINVKSNKIYEQENELKRVKLVADEICGMKQLRSSSCLEKKCDDNKPEKETPCCNSFEKKYSTVGKYAVNPKVQEEKENENPYCNSCEKTNSIVEKYSVNPDEHMNEDIAMDLKDIIKAIKNIQKELSSPSSSSHKIQKKVRIKE